VNATVDFHASHFHPSNLESHPFVPLRKNPRPSADIRPHSRSPALSLNSHKPFRSLRSEVGQTGASVPGWSYEPSCQSCVRQEATGRLLRAVRVSDRSLTLAALSGEPPAPFGLRTLLDNMGQARVLENAAACGQNSCSGNSHPLCIEGGRRVDFSLQSSRGNRMDGMLC
jgi:hypothetical protein